MVMAAKTSGVHPLCNESVLEGVAKFLDHRSLRYLRLVNTHVNHSILLTFRKRTAIYLGRRGRPDSITFFRDPVATIEVFVDTFLSALSRTATTTTTKTCAISNTTTTTITTTTWNPVELDTLHMYFPVHVENPHIRQWLTSYGKNVKHLYVIVHWSDWRRPDHPNPTEKYTFPIDNFQADLISWCSNLETLLISRPIIPSDFLNTIPSKLISLKSLQLGSNDFSGVFFEKVGENENAGFLATARFILGMLGSLEILKLTNENGTEGSYDESQILPLFTSPVCPGILKTLKTLDFQHFLMVPRMLEEMTELGFESLSNIGIGPLTSYTPQSVESIRSFIQFFAPKLENLRLWRLSDYKCSEDGPFCLHFDVIFPLLNTFIISIDTWNINFNPTLFPALESFEMSTAVDYDDHPLIHPKYVNPFETCTGVHSFLRNLQFPYCIQNEKVSQSLVQLFPNLQSIEVQIRAQGLQSALSNLSSLRSLRTIKMSVFHDPGNIFTATEKNELCLSDVVEKMTDYKVDRGNLKIALDDSWTKFGEWAGEYTYRSLNGFHLNGRMSQTYRRRCRDDCGNRRVQIYEEKYFLRRIKKFKKELEL